MQKSVLNIFINQYCQHSDKELEEILSRQENLISATKMRIEAIEKILDAREAGQRNTGLVLK